jgi:hypothetical protein
MFQGRKGLRVTSRWILLAATALLLSGVGLLAVPGAGADKITQTNGCGVGKDTSVRSHETDGNGDQNGNGDKTGTGNGDDKSKCGDTDGNGNDGDGDDNGGGNGCQSDSSVVHSDTIDASGDSADCDGKGEGNDNDSDDACVTTVQNDCDGGGNGNDNDGDDVGGTTGPTGATGETTTITTATSGVTTTAPSGVQQIKGASSSKGKAKACTSRRLFVIRVRHPHGQYLVAANVTVNGKRVATMRGNRISSTIKLVGLPKGTVKVHIRAVTNKGKVLHGVRTYHTCVAGHHGSVPKL